LQFANIKQINHNTTTMKKHLERCKHSAGCSKAFCPAADPLPGGAGRPKFNQMQMVNTFTYRWVWWRLMHAVSSYRGNRPTNKHTQTDRTDNNTLCR